jgi:hypothetical protein
MGWCYKIQWLILYSSDEIYMNVIYMGLSISPKKMSGVRKLECSDLIEIEAADRL